MLDERDLVRSLRKGDEAAFESLVNAYHSSLVAVALPYVRDLAAAEEVAQETWLGVVHGIHRFEGRSSLKTWIFRILVNSAKTYAKRQGRLIPMAELQRPGPGEPAVEGRRFLGEDHPQWPGHWSSPPAGWDEAPEGRLLSRETLSVVREAIDQLPPAQRLVIWMRDVEGLSAEEVCEVLPTSRGNQRVLLHRARSKVRSALESYLTQ